MTDEIVSKVRLLSKKGAQDYLVKLIYMLSDWSEYNREEIRQYDEISLERELYEWEKDDYNACMRKYKSYQGILNLIAIDFGVSD